MAPHLRKRLPLPSKPVEATPAPKVEEKKPTPEPANAEQTAAPKQEPPSPYEGLEARQVALYTQAEGLLEPVASKGAAAYANLKEAERKAKAVMRLGAFKVSLNREAETRLRATLAEETKAQAKGSEYAAAWAKLWPREYDMREVFQSRTMFPAKEALTAAYEKALDEGAEFPTEIRRTLGEMARSEGVPTPEFEVDLNSLSELLRTALLEQSVTGDHLFLMALAVRERGEDVLRRRNFSRTFHGLVSALPEVPNRAAHKARVGPVPRVQARRATGSLERASEQGLVVGYR